MQPQELDEYTQQVPEEWRERFAEIVALTDSLCDAHLNDEYKDLSRRMTAALCQEGSPANRGRPASWASGVVYSVGWVNFLSDPNVKPHMAAAEIANALGVSESTMQAKARVLREGLDLVKFDPSWCTASTLDHNPLAWMIEIDGMLLDTRSAPRELQVEAYEQGLIPYVYVDRRAGERDENIIARIGPETHSEAGRPAKARASQSGASVAGLTLFDVPGTRPSDHPAPPRRRKGPAKIYVLKITLKRSKPPIWRRVAVPSDIKLSDLHDVIQTVMGWHNCHLHQFAARDGRRFGSSDPDFGLEDVYDEQRYRLHDIAEGKGARFDYEYDFGDGWEHRIEVVKAGPPERDVAYPVCLAGKCACPPEDCGGIWGYYDMLKALEDPRHEMHQTYREWLSRDFDPDVFECQAVNGLLGRVR